MKILGSLMEGPRYDLRDSDENDGLLRILTWGSGIDGEEPCGNAYGLKDAGR